MKQTFLKKYLNDGIFDISRWTCQESRYFFDIIYFNIVEVYLKEKYYIMTKWILLFLKLQNLSYMHIT